MHRQRVRMVWFAIAFVLVACAGTFGMVALLGDMSGTVTAQTRN
jgi:hypothetical protein